MLFKKELKRSRQRGQLLFLFFLMKNRAQKLWSSDNLAFFQFFTNFKNLLITDYSAHLARFGRDKDQNDVDVSAVGYFFGQWGNP